MFRPFAIVCMGRTGSTLLGGLLDSHPEIECRGELFGSQFGYVEHPGISRKEFLEHHAYVTDLPIRGFKMPLDWVFNHPGIFDDFKALGYKIIRLDRRNALEHLVSIKLAQINTDWSSARHYTVQKTRVTPLELYNFIGARNAYNVVLDKFSEPLPNAHFPYEDLLKPNSQEQILRFLGASGHALTTRTMRQRSGTLADSIENFSELSAELSRTPYAALLEPVPHA